MNITFLVHDIHFVGGGERATANLANHFVSKGNMVTIVSVSSSGTNNIFNISDQVQIEYLNIELNKGFKLIRKIESVFAVRRFFRVINHQTYVLGIGNYPSILVALIPNKHRLIKIGCQHGSYNSVKHFWIILRWLLYRKLKAVVSLTQKDVAKLQKLNNQVFVIPNSVSFFPDYPADLQNKIILSIGRIDYPKGYDLLLEVFNRFCIENKEWILRIIGDGPLRETIRGIASDKGILDRISIVPLSAQITEEYLNASVYVMTSRTEGLPMVILEAQACGLPVVSFNCETGPSDIINNGKDGYLVDNYDIDEMNIKLKELCSDLDKRKEFGQNARKNVEKFFPDNVFNKWEALFSQLQTQI